jgi:hypothetical protein
MQNVSSEHLVNTAIPLNPLWKTILTQGRASAHSGYFYAKKAKTRNSRLQSVYIRPYHRMMGGSDVRPRVSMDYQSGLRGIAELTIEMLYMAQSPEQCEVFILRHLN